MATSFRTADQLTFTTDGTAIACRMQATENKLTFDSVSGAVGLSNVGVVEIIDTSISSSETTGALIVAGGVGIGGDTFCNGNVNIASHDLKIDNYHISEEKQRLKISSDLGASWKETETLGNGSKGSFALSRNGLVSYCTSGGPDGIRVSFDKGIQWQATTAPIIAWNNLATNMDGTIVCATAGTLGVYLSIDSGGTWSQVATSYVYDYTNVAMSGDGVYITLVGYGSKVVSSQDGGISFIVKAIPPQRPWSSLSMVADGTFQLGTAYNTTRCWNYYSINYGLNWSQLPLVSEIFIGSSVSGQDGTYILAYSETALYRSVDRGCGVIAQDVLNVLPEIVRGHDKNEYAVDYQSLFVKLLASHQNVQHRLEVVEKKLQQVLNII
jgi:hypothetical protein